MIRIRFIAAIVGGALLVAAMPAAAAVKIAKFSGTVKDGFDTTGVFGAPNTDLTGYGWTAIYIYDRNLGALRNSGPTFDVSYGGTPQGYPSGSPVISAKITINGVSRTISGKYDAILLTMTNPFVGFQAADLIPDPLSGITRTYNTLRTYANPAGAPASLDQNFGPVTAFNSSGGTEWSTYDQMAGIYIERAYANFGPEMVHSVGNPVPEPRSWSLMIAGFGLVGAAMRRRAGVVA